jgi:hypothetical protein
MKKFVIKIIQENIQFSHRPIVIRGGESVSSEMGDIDILVRKNELKKTIFEFVNHITKNGWQVISYRKLFYLSSIIIINDSKFPSNSLKIDFFNGIGWYGLVKKKYDDLFFNNKTDSEIIMSSITLVHKLTYAGSFNQKDFYRLGDNIKTSLEFLELDNIINEKVIRNGIISTFLKWKIRFKISNYKKHEIIKWFSSVFYRVLISSFKKNISLGRFIYISCNGADKNEIEKKLSNVFVESGDKVIPKFILLSTNSNLKSKNKLLKLLSLIYYNISIFILNIKKLNGKYYFLFDVNNNLKNLNKMPKNHIDLNSKSFNKFNPLHFSINKIIFQEIKADLKISI